MPVYAKDAQYIILDENDEESNSQPFSQSSTNSNYETRALVKNSANEGVFFILNKFKMFFDLINSNFNSSANRF